MTRCLGLTDDKRTTGVSIYNFKSSLRLMNKRIQSVDGLIFGVSMFHVFKCYYKLMKIIN